MWTVSPICSHRRGTKFDWQRIFGLFGADDTQRFVTGKLRPFIAIIRQLS